MPDFNPTVNPASQNSGTESCPDSGYIQKPERYIFLANGEAIEIEALIPGSMQGEETGHRADFVYSDPEARRDRRLELAAASQDWTPKRCQTALGVINNLLYHAGACYGAVSRDAGGLLVACREKLISLIQEPAILLKNALASTAEYLKQWWPGASRNINTIRDVIEELQDIGLLSHYSQRGAGKRSRVYNYLDIPGLLLLAEALEKRLGYENLPEHGAALLQKLYNALFSGWGYNREGEPDSQAPRGYEESVAVRRERGWRFRQAAVAAVAAAGAAYHHLRSLFGPSDPLVQAVLEDGQSRYGPDFADYLNQK